jgi:hypothetical protein
MDQQKREKDPDMIFTIKDPFDKPHNPGRARLIDKHLYMDNFAKAIFYMNSKKKDDIENLFK